MGCSAGIESLGGFGRVAVPGLRGAGRHSATTQNFSLTSDVSVQRFGVVHPGRSITALGQQSCKRTLPSPALMRKQFLGSCAGQAQQVNRSQYCQHCLVSCPRASSATRIFGGVVVFLRCIGAPFQADAKARGRCEGAVHMEAKAWTQMTSCLGSY